MRAIAIVNPASGHRCASMPVSGQQHEIQTKQARMVKIIVAKGEMPIQAGGKILDDAYRKVTMEILPNQLEVKFSRFCREKVRI